jgi:hypothetical protein
MGESPILYHRIIYIILCTYVFLLARREILEENGLWQAGCTALFSDRAKELDKSFWRQMQMVSHPDLNMDHLAPKMIM